MATIGDALREAASRLADVSGTPRLDAELLMAHAIGIGRERMLLSRLREEAPGNFPALIDRRLAHEPVAYILGARDFWTISLRVGPGALVPRPDSETLIEAALDRFGSAGPGRILDLGTGPGTLLLAALDLWPRASGLGVDRSEAVLVYARANAAALGLDARAVFRLGDWAGEVDERFDLILCNPPYVESSADLPADVARWEPAGALFAGEDGLDAYRRLAPMLPALLAPGGVACVEIGAGQEQAVTALLAAQRLAVAPRRDLGGHVRCLIAELDPL